jgi:hypothetical protein
MSRTIGALLPSETVTDLLEPDGRFEGGFNLVWLACHVGSLLGEGGLAMVVETSRASEANRMTCAFSSKPVSNGFTFTIMIYTLSVQLNDWS